MRFSDARLLARRLSTPAIARRALILSALVLAERLLVAAAAWALVGRSSREKIALAFALGVVFCIRTFAQHAFRARTEAELLERVVGSLIEGDVLRVSALPDEDASAELGQAVYLSAKSVSLELPRLFADALAAALLAVFIVAHEPWRLAALAIGMTLLAAVALLATRRSMEQAVTAAWEAQRRVFAGVVEALEGRLDVVASGRRRPFLAQMHVLARAWATAGTRVAAEALFSNKLPLLAVALAVAMAVALAGRLAVGAATADVALLAGATPAFSGVAQGILAFIRAERWLDSVARALAEKRVSAVGTRVPPSLPAPIGFERVSFSYEGTPRQALRDVSFVWEPDSVLALAGSNGSGKSTCLRLLLALGQPQSGAVTVGGAKLDAIDADLWRATVAFLPQRPYLPLLSSVRSAIHFLSPDATDESVRLALDRVGLLASLSRGGRDPLAVRVDTLSFGERQRVAVARMLCQQASLVLLDEPDANLDRAGIALIADLVRELSRDRMVALAAHTRELLDVADRVVLLDRGRVVRDGARVSEDSLTESVGQSAPWSPRG